jgi:chromosome segregation ATPase
VSKGNRGGVLDGFNQRFAAKLNVLIGGRGTGKSSVIELIRFGLGASAYTDAAQQESMEHALGVLGDGRVTITLSNGRDRIEVARTAQDAEVELPDAFVAPFVFSQAEIETIGLQAQSRLRLIGGCMTPAQRPMSSESSAAAKIRSTTAEIRALLSEIDDIDEKTAELPKLQAQLEAQSAQRGAQTAVHKEIEGHRTALAEVTPQVAAARVRSEVIARPADRLTEWTDALEDVLDRRPTIERWPSQAATADELTDLRKRETQVNVRLRGGLEDLKAIAAELARKKATAASQHTGLENRARDVRQKIEEKQKGLVQSISASTISCSKSQCSNRWLTCVRNETRV